MDRPTKIKPLINSRSCFNPFWRVVEEYNHGHNEPSDMAEAHRRDHPDNSCGCPSAAFASCALCVHELECDSEHSIDFVLVD